MAVEYKEELVLTCTCERCGYVWKAAGDLKPETCARCRSAYWNKPKKIASQQSA